jgi:branched-chain amino acid transport system permease protein
MKKFLRPVVLSLWFSFLFLPLRGARDAAFLFIVLIFAIPILKILSETFGKISRPGGALGRYMPRDRRYLAVALIPVAILPFLANDYALDVATISGIYIILALGLNVVVGFAGLLNLGFAAFYAIGAYSYALLNTRLGLGFWSALPVSVLLTAASGFLLAIPALRLKGDYLAIVTLGFGEIVRLILNNWDRFTRGPNGISGIDPPYFLGTPVSGLMYYYFLVLFFVVLTVFVMHRVKDSKTGRAWISIREDEIASAAMGIPTTRYKLYAFAFGALWAGLAGCLFAAKMRFVSPESFTFVESVLILCMVIVGGIGSITGVVLGAVLLVFLPEILREAQSYRMLVVGCALVFLMIFRPQGLFGSKSVSLGG